MVLVAKLEIEFATTQHLLVVVKTALSMGRAIQNLECATIEDAQVSCSNIDVIVN